MGREWRAAVHESTLERIRNREFNAVLSRLVTHPSLCPPLPSAHPFLLPTPSLCPPLPSAHPFPLPTPSLCPPLPSAHPFPLPTPSFSPPLPSAHPFLLPTPSSSFCPPLPLPSAHPFPFLLPTPSPSFCPPLPLPSAHPFPFLLPTPSPSFRPPLPLPSAHPFPFLPPTPSPSFCPPLPLPSAHPFPFLLPTPSPSFCPPLPLPSAHPFLLPTPSFCPPLPSPHPFPLPTLAGGRRRAAVHVSTLEQIRNREFDALLEYDELQREIREGRGFYKFQEAPITFAPTFKVIRNEVGKYNAKRLPAWCDRILWRSLSGCQLACTRYDAAHDVGSSDHKPVLAEFELTTHALPVGLDPADASLVAAEEGVVGMVARRLHRSASSRHGDMRWHIQFASLMGSDLLSADANGLSDPYVRFTGPNLQHSSHTKPRYRTLNPVWTQEDISSIVLENLSLQSHEKDYLLAAILDHDVTNQDDPIGFTTIPLAPAVHALRANNGSSFVDFKVEVTYKGMPAGHLHGSFRLTWAATKHRSSKCAQM
ncbi:unnamed protein product [Closterium sp. NIES-64]|nr:unnamed protein product [Closterium sp. NIES-64]